MDYDKMTVVEMRALLKSRNMKVSGTKPELISRLKGEKVEVSKNEKKEDKEVLICQAVVKTTGKPCDKKATYQADDKYLCGIHCKSAQNAQPLTEKKEPGEAKKAKEKKKIVERDLTDEERKEANKDENHWVVGPLEMIKISSTEKDQIDQKREENDKLGYRGNLKLNLLRQGIPPSVTEGYLALFFTRDPAIIAYGLDISMLSPSQLGPVEHKMSNLPAAANLLNFIQFSQIYAFELKKKVKDAATPYDYGELKTSSLENRKIDYEDPLPHSTKLEMYEFSSDSTSNKYLFSLFYTLDGQEKRFDEIEARFFYCYYYAQLVSSTPEFKKLDIKLLESGFNLEIWTDTKYEITHKYIFEVNPEEMYSHYIDSSKPFGYEMMLFCLLTIPDPKNLPWNLYRAQHAELYENFGFINL